VPVSRKETEHILRLRFNFAAARKELPLVVIQMDGVISCFKDHQLFFRGCKKYSWLILLEFLRGLQMLRKSCLVAILLDSMTPSKRRAIYKALKKVEVDGIY